MEQTVSKPLLMRSEQPIATPEVKTPVTDQPARNADLTSTPTPTTAPAAVVVQPASVEPSDSAPTTSSRGRLIRQPITFKDFITSK